jgi:hypothetical protein
MHRRLIVTLLVLLVACAPQAAPVPVLPSITPLVTGPTVSPGGSTPAIGTPQPGLILRGTVQLEDGTGLAGVSICRNFASYSGKVIAKTDASGNFESAFTSIPGDEMVGVWAVAPGYTFQPDVYRWRHNYGSEDRGLDFIAAPSADTPAPPFPCE